MRCRAVFDTNTVVSALLFQQGRLAWIRGAWSAGAIAPVVCKETVEELLRVLAYPKFQLDRNEIDDLLGDFLPFAEVIDLSPSDWPNCRDEDDRMFLALAEQAQADVLMTGDADLPEVAETFSVKIQTPAALKAELGFGG
ncbi:MAG: putative toxin-antitoxin system toxin component, PIN family [Sedimenticolaceae bacterium]